jgi:hypothetical protein
MCGGEERMGKVMESGREREREESKVCKTELQGKVGESGGKKEITFDKVPILCLNPTWESGIEWRGCDQLGDSERRSKLGQSRGGNEQNRTPLNRSASIS